MIPRRWNSVRRGLPFATVNGMQTQTEGGKQRAAIVFRCFMLYTVRRYEGVDIVWYHSVSPSGGRGPVAPLLPG